MNSFKKIISVLFLLVTLCSFIPKPVVAQIIDPGAIIGIGTAIQVAGATHNVSGQTTASSSKKEEVIGKYKFIAPIEPLVSGLVDSSTGMVDLTKGNPIYKYVQALFMFLVGVGGVLGVVRLVMVGFEIITSAAKVDAHSKIRAELTSIIISLLLVASSYVFLNTVNSQLVTSQLAFPVVTSSPSVIMYGKEPTDPGYYYKYELKDSGQIKYSKKYRDMGEEDDKIRAMVVTKGKFPNAGIIIPVVGPAMKVGNMLGEAAISWWYNNSCRYNEKITELQGEDGLLFNDDVYMRQPCQWYPASQQDPASSPAAQSEDDVRRTLAASGVYINRSRCLTTRKDIKCTDVRGLGAETVSFIGSFAQTFFSSVCAVQGKTCPVMVNGGSESWLHKGHNTDDVFDLNYQKEIEYKLEQNSTFVAPGYSSILNRYLWYEYWFNDEQEPDKSNHHFHVCKQNDKSNLNMCGGTWGGANNPLECVPKPGSVDQYLCRSGRAICTTEMCKKVDWNMTCASLPNDNNLPTVCKDAKAAGKNLKDVKAIQPFKNIYSEYY